MSKKSIVAVYHIGKPKSSVNRMAAGSRLPRSSHGIFSPFYNFSNTPYLPS